MKKAIKTLIMICITIPALAQNNDSLNYYTDSLIKAYEIEDRLQKNKYESVFLKNEFKKVEGTLKKFERIKNYDVQIGIFNLYGKFLTKQNSPSGKEKVINAMLRACSDSLDYRMACSNSILQLVNKADTSFNEENRVKLFSLISYNYTKYSYPEPELLRMAGIQNLVQCQEAIKVLASDTSTYFYKWDAKMALARLGDKHAISHCINHIDSLMHNYCTMPMEDCILSNIKDISYIKQEEALKYYEYLLFSNNSQIFEKGNGAILTIRYAYLGILQLQKDVKNFPKLSILSKDLEDSIKSAKEWFIKNKWEIEFIENRW